MMFPLVHGLLSLLGGDVVTEDLNYKALMKRLNAWAYWPLNESANGSGSAVKAGTVLADDSGNYRNGAYSAVYAQPAAGGQVATFTKVVNQNIGYRPPGNELLSTMTITSTFDVAAIRIYVDINHPRAESLIMSFDGGGDGFCVLLNNNARGVNFKEWFTSHIVQSLPNDRHINHFDYNVLGHEPYGPFKLWVGDNYGSQGYFNSWTVVLYDAAAAANLAAAGPILSAPNVVPPLVYTSDPHTRLSIKKVDSPNITLYRLGPLDYTRTTTVLDSIVIAGIRVSLNVYYAYRLDALKISLVHNGESVPLHSYVQEDDEALVLSYVSDSALSGDRLRPGLQIFNGASSQGDWSLRFENATQYEVNSTLNTWTIEFVSALAPSVDYAKGFDGSRGIPVATSAAPLLESDNLPVKEFEAWLKFGDIVSGQVIYREGDNTNGWALGVDGGNLAVGISTGGAIKKVVYPLAGLDVNQKYLVSGLVDTPNNTLKLFMNAEAIAVATGMALAPHNSSVGAMIGSSYDPVSGQNFNPLTGATTSNGFVGLIDNPTIYDYEREPHERGWVYTAGNTGIVTVPYVDIYDNRISFLEGDIHYPLSLAAPEIIVPNVGAAPNSDAAIVGADVGELEYRLPSVLGRGYSIGVTSNAYFEALLDSANAAVTANDSFTYLFGYANDVLHIDGHVVAEFIDPDYEGMAKGTRAAIRVAPDGRLRIEIAGIDMNLDDSRDWRVDFTGHLFAIKGSYSSGDDSWTTKVFIDGQLVKTFVNSLQPPA